MPHSPRSVFVLLRSPESSHPRRYRYHLLEERENYLQAVSEDKINSGSIRLLMYDDFNDFLYILWIIDFSNWIFVCFRIFFCCNKELIRDELQAGGKFSVRRQSLRATWEVIDRIVCSYLRVICFSPILCSPACPSQVAPSSSCSACEQAATPQNLYSNLVASSPKDFASALDKPAAVVFV